MEYKTEIPQRHRLHSPNFFRFRRLFRRPNARSLILEDQPINPDMKPALTLLAILLLDRQRALQNG
jgi:hypothetical protein